MLSDRIRSELERHRMVLPGERVLVAVSGGPDSVALLSILATLRPALAIDLHAVHVHHGLRPEADLDARFVEDLGRRLDLPTIVEKVNVRDLQRSGRLSVEVAARRARYDALRRVARAVSAQRVALGHTADDQAETVLMRLVQGAGPTGLGGIPPVRGPFIRPLLGCWRYEIVAYLRGEGLPWVEDTSNRTLAPIRNRVRWADLPSLEQRFGPSLRRALVRLGDAAREGAEALRFVARQQFTHLRLAAPEGSVALPLDGLRALLPGLQVAVLQEALAELTGGGAVRLRHRHLVGLRSVVEGDRRSVGLPERIIAFARESRLLLSLPEPAPFPVGSLRPLPVPGELSLADFGICLCATLHERATCDGWWQGDPSVAYFDADALPGPLAVRARAIGDRFRPFGLDGTRRLKKFFIDLKLPRRERDRVPLLLAGGEICWVVGLRRGAQALISEGTTRVLRVEVHRVADAAGRLVRSGGVC